MGIFDWFRRDRPIPEPPATEAVSVAGVSVIGGVSQTDEKDQDWSTPSRKFKREKELIRNVAIIGAGVTAFQRLCAGVTWSARPPKNLQGGSEADAKEQAEWVIEMFGDMGAPFGEAVGDTCMHVFTGSAVATTQGKLRPDDLMGLENLWPVAPNTISAWLTDDVGQVRGIIQKGPSDGFKDHAIPRSRMVYARQKILGDAPEGEGLLRLCATLAKSLEVYRRIEGTGLQGNLSGVPVIYAPKTEMMKSIGQPKPGGGTVTEYDVTRALEPADDFSSGHVRTAELGLTFDSEPYRDNTGNPVGGPKWKAEILSSESGAAADAHVAIERDIRQAARILGVEHMLLGGDGSGSLALGREKILMFKLLVDACLERIAWVYRRDILRSFIWPHNGWDPRTIPVLVPKATALRDVAGQMSVVEGVARAGVTVGRKDKAVAELYEAVDLTAPDPEDEDLSAPLDFLPDPAQPVPPGDDPDAVEVNVDDESDDPARPGAREDATPEAA